MKVIKYIAVLATFGVMPMSLQAMSLNFNLANGDGLASAFTAFDGGVTVTVTAQAAGTPPTPIVVARSSMYGMGACDLADTRGCGASLNPEYELDSFDPPEILSFAFSSAIYLDGITFSSLNEDEPGDRFTLMVDGAAYNGVYDPQTNPFAFPSSIKVMSSFSIVADETTLSSFWVKNIHATALPEPGTLGMLVFGLVAVGFMRRRKTY